MRSRAGLKGLIKHRDQKIRELQLQLNDLKERYNIALCKLRQKDIHLSRSKPSKKWWQFWKQ